MTWIKMRVCLATHPKVVTLASRLGVTRSNVIGALFQLWAVTDQHAGEDGTLPMSASDVDTVVELPGFAAQMERVGWLAVVDENTVNVPEYHEHNGSTAKTRAGAAKRQSRKRNAPVTVKRDETVTREKKSREEKKESLSGATFDLFWDTYPRKAAKQAARKAWDKAVAKTEPKVIIEAVRAFAESKAAETMQFVPYPGTWLNAARWLDDRSEWNVQRGDKTVADKRADRDAATDWSKWGKENGQ